MSPNANITQILQEHYEACFKRFGDTAKGADWPSEQCAQQRYQVMAELLPNQGNQFSILDYGCGVGRFYDFLSSHKSATQFQYLGCDVSPEIIRNARALRKEAVFVTADELRITKRQYDYTICNGVFTEKLTCSHKDFFAYLKQTLSYLFQRTRCGLAFNVMSKNVAWERTDLFHPSLDELTWFVTQELTPNFMVRQDYGLYECTLYLKRSGEISP